METLQAQLVSTFCFNVISWKICVFLQKMDHYPDDGLNLISNEQYKCAVFVECDVKSQF